MRVIDVDLKDQIYVIAQNPPLTYHQCIYDQLLNDDISQVHVNEMDVKYVNFYLYVHTYKIR